MNKKLITSTHQLLNIKGQHMCKAALSSRHHETVNRDLFIAAAARLQDMLRLATPDQIHEALSSMGPACFLDDLTNGQLVGAMAVFNWILDNSQWRNGALSASSTYKP